MKTEVLFNDGWEFTKQKLDTSLEDVCTNKDCFVPVGLPHDWLIEQTNDLYENSAGWYRKNFLWNKTDGELVSLCFDGVYMDCQIYVNRRLAKEWKYGYSAFEVAMTPYLQNGNNEIIVCVRHQSPNSRWYSGAGIYRDVRLRSVWETHIPKNGIYVTAIKKQKDMWSLEIDTEVICKEETTLVYTLFDEEECVVWDSREFLNSQRDIIVHTVKTLVSNPQLWDICAPKRYCLKVGLWREEMLLQEEAVWFGFRETAFDANKGFSLNGRHVKLKGVCEHHDLGCLGAAYNRTAMHRKFVMLQKMGVNAVRLSHNMPAADLMDLADEMGMLIVSEAFDMWERTKTDYDYGRFFKNWYQKDVASWIRRDRNHPSVIMWSVGNEIYDTHVDEGGQQIARALLLEVRKHDPKNHAPVTIGSNYMPWENAQKCADIIETVGYNYAENYYNPHHKIHPDWVIYGSETSSTVQSRGVYHFPYRRSVLAEEDLQCSALGNSTTSWGANPPRAVLLRSATVIFHAVNFCGVGLTILGSQHHTTQKFLFWTD